MDDSKEKLLGMLTSEEEEEQYASITEDGEFVIRFVHNSGDPERRPFLRVFTHYNFIDPTDGVQREVKCLGSGCPLCQLSRDLKAKGKISDSKKLKARVSFLYHAFIKGRLRTLRVNYTLQKSLIGEAGDMGALVEVLHLNGINVFDADKGRLVKITRRTVGTLRSSDGDEFLNLKFTVVVSSKDNSLDEARREELRGRANLESHIRAISKAEALSMADHTAAELGVITNFGDKVVNRRDKIKKTLTNVDDLVVEGAEDFSFDDIY